MGLFRANNIVANFWMLFATLSAYGVVTSEVGPGVDRKALAHVAGEQISWESAIVVSWFFYQVSFSLYCFFIACLRMEPPLKSTQLNAKMALVSLVICFLIFKMGDRFLSSL